MDEGHVRAWIQWRTERGSLPSLTPDLVLAARGSGMPCACCGRVIAHHEVEYELAWNDAECVHVRRMHLRCHQIWDAQRDGNPLRMAIPAPQDLALGGQPAWP